MISAIAIDTIPFHGINVEVTHLEWNFDEAVVSIYCPDENAEVHVRFNNKLGPCSLRLLDESDMSATWAHVNMGTGWLYRIKSGGWITQEATRDDFITKDLEWMKEFLIVGLDACVSVITKEDFEIYDPTGKVVARIKT